MRTQNRRQFLTGALAAPIAARSLLAKAHQPASRYNIISDGTCLSEESAKGYRSILPINQFCPAAPEIIIVAAALIPSDRLIGDLRSRVHCGAWLIWEQAARFDDDSDEDPQRKFLEDTFGLRLKSAYPHFDSLYTRYFWPLPALLRSFGRVTQVDCAENEILASYASQPIATKRNIGRGGIVFLGGMLGPHLAARDREAQLLTDQLVRALL